MGILAIGVLSSLLLFVVVGWGLVSQSASYLQPPLVILPNKST